MLRQRMTAFADDEIRLLFNGIFESLVLHYPERFQGWKAAPAPDSRVGLVLQLPST
jgi:hypothetical protein